MPQIVSSEARKYRKRKEPSRITLRRKTALIEVRLDGTSAIVDVEDVPLVGGRKWCFNRGSVRGVSVPFEILSRILMGLSPEDRRRVDHINGNGLDNRRSNLRIADAAQNGWNRTKLNKNNKSGVHGVRAIGSSWSAHIFVRRKSIHLGTFKTLEEAAKARRRAEKKYFGEFAPRDLS